MSSGLKLTPPSPPPSLDGIGTDARIPLMVEWFRANFEHPDESTPYITREGGYQWIWGGPYDTSEQIADAFPEATDEEREQAVEEIEEQDGISDWAPHSSRIQPDGSEDGEEDDSPNEPPAPPSSDQLSALRGRLDDIERLITEWRPHAHMLGHNHPPEEFRTGLSHQDLDEAQESIAEVRLELDKDDPANKANPEVLYRAENRFKKLARALWGMVLVVGGGLVVGASNEAGSELISDPVAFYTKVELATSTIQHWAQWAASTLF